MGSLPLGLQQLIELGRVLFSGARIIILDEPTSALSPPEIERLFGVLRRLRESGKSLIFISHFLDDVLSIADEVTIFRNGRKIVTAPTGGIDKAWVIERMIGVPPLGPSVARFQVSVEAASRLVNGEPLKVPSRRLTSAVLSVPESGVQIELDIPTDELRALAHHRAP
jgi:ABC-type sugar transport system ATPase subunit